MSAAAQLMGLVQKYSETLDARKKNVLYGNCRELLDDFPKHTFTACVTDPPYELGFMGKSWDKAGVSFDPETWRKVLRVLKPGAFLLAFGGTRTFHRIAVAIEDAGFEIRDTVMWCYGSGFPKSHDVSKAIDRAAGEERDVVRTTKSGGYKRLMVHNAEDGFRPADYYPEGNKFTSNDPVTEQAKKWNGYGSALKPAWEPIIVAMKPLDGTFAENALEHGVAGLAIDKCRVKLTRYDHEEYIPNRVGYKDGIDHKQKSQASTGFIGKTTQGTENQVIKPEGRWPANLIHDGSEEVVGLFPNAQSGKSNGDAEVGESGRATPMRRGNLISRNDNGSAARFFYCAKASRSEREAGLDRLPLKPGGSNAKGYCDDVARGVDRNRPTANHHPTVKPLALMEYLLKLVTYPENNYILDPFCGSGSTLVAAQKLGIEWCGIDNDIEVVEIARERVRNA